MSEFDTVELLNVAFVFMEDGLKHQATFPSNSSCLHLKERLGGDLNIPLQNLSLYHENKKIDSETKLMQLGKIFY